MHPNWPDKQLREQLTDYDSPMSLDDGWKRLDRARRRRKRRGTLLWWIGGVGLLLLAAIGWGLSVPIETTVAAPPLSDTAATPAIVPARSGSVPTTLSSNTIGRTAATTATPTPAAPAGAVRPPKTFYTDRARSDERAAAGLSPASIAQTALLRTSTTPSFVRGSERVTAAVRTIAPPEATPTLRPAAVVLPSDGRVARLSLTRLPFLAPDSLSIAPQSPKAELPPPVALAPRPRWWLGTVAGYGAAFRRDGMTNVPLEQWRQELEQPLDSRELGVQLTREGRDGLALHLATGYRIDVDRIDFDRTRVDSLTQNQPVAILNKLDGSTETILGDTLAVATTQARRLHHLRYSSAFVRVAATKTFSLRPRWFVLLEGGLQLDVARRASGTTFANPADWSQRLALADVDYRSAGSLGLTAGFGVRYTIADRWRVGALAYGNYGLTNLRPGNAARAEYRSALSGQLRLAYRLR